MSPDTRPGRRSALIDAVRTFIGAPFPIKPGKPLRKGTLNRRVVATYGVWDHEVSYHAIKGWRTNRRPS